MLNVTPTLRSAMIAAAALIGLSVSTPVDAKKPGPFGIGVMLGDPSGVSGKVYLQDTMALDFGVGVGFFGGNNFHTHADLLFQYGLRSFSAGQLDWFIGGGPKFSFFWSGRGNGNGNRARSALGGRGAAGLSWTFKHAPVELFMEAAAGFWLVDFVAFDFDGSVGARYYF